MADSGTVKAALEAQRAAIQEQRDQLRRDLDDVIAAQADVATDDEHDPEGATIAYERSRLISLIERTEADLGDIDVALERLAAGRYGVCESCGDTISPARLEARPAVRTCIACASGVAR